jgi:hypothetical protein
MATFLFSLFRKITFVIGVVYGFFHVISCWTRGWLWQVVNCIVISCLAHGEAVIAAYRRFTLLQKRWRMYSHGGISVKTSFYWRGETGSVGGVVEGVGFRELLADGRREQLNLALPPEVL